ncbi:hypothetical protein [Nocardioides sp. P5_E3]
MPSNRLLERRWVLTPLLIFVVSRLVSGVMLAIGAGRQAAIGAGTAGYHVTTPTPSSPGYLGVVSNWDGQWYRGIAEQGYPSVLPQVDGDVVPNEWAFSAGYPFVVRFFMAVLRIDFPLAATIVSLACAAAAVVLLYALVRDRMDEYAAVTLTLALCCFPSAPVLQVAYTESMSLLLVVLALRALSHRSYGWLLVWAALLSVTRPVSLPLALLCSVVWLIRWRNRDDEEFPVRERWVAAASAAACFAMVGIWPAIAAVATRNPTAFTETMAAWPVNKSLGGPAVNWLTLAAMHTLAVGAFVFPVLALVLYSAIRRPTRLLPAAWRWWAPVYMVYILAATKPSAGILRYVLIAVFPLVPLLEPRSSTTSRADAMMQWLVPCLFALAGLVGQYYWVTKIFTIDEAPTLQPFP